MHEHRYGVNEFVWSLSFETAGRAVRHYWTKRIFRNATSAIHGRIDCAANFVGHIDRAVQCLSLVGICAAAVVFARAIMYRLGLRII